MESSKQSILVPVDFNEQSMIALEQAYNLAKFSRDSIILLYVLEDQGLANSLISSEMLEKSINDKLNALVKNVSDKTDVKVVSVLKKGKVYAEILKAVKEFNSRIVVMGTNNSTEAIRMDRNMIGSNTSKVIRQSSVPVISINGKEHNQLCRKILLPLDLTKSTKQKVTHAIDIAKLFGASIEVVSVLWSAADKEIHQELIQQLYQVQKFVERGNVSINTKLIEVEGGEKQLVPTILNYAQELGNIDLIMIMSQQETKLIEYFIGSSAQRIIRMSSIPVMSINPKEIGYERLIF